MQAYRIFLVLIFLALATQARCSLSAQVGVASNILIAEGRVYFAQSDRTLTVLSLETGEVIARKRNLDYGGFLQIFHKRLLASNYWGLTLVDPLTFKIIWQARDVRDLIVEGNKLITNDGNGLTECRDGDTGKVLWSFNLPGGYHVATGKGKVLVFRSGKYGTPKGVSSVVLLDLESGRELLHKTSPPDVNFWDAYFDGDRIYFAGGAYEITDGPDGRRESRRQTARFDKLTVWDLNGTEMEPLPVPDDLRGKQVEEPFTIGDKVFSETRVWKSLEDAEFRRKGTPRYVELMDVQHSSKPVVAYRYDLADGNATLIDSNDKPGIDRPEEQLIEAEFTSSAGTWRGSLPYLNNTGGIVEAADAEGKIIFGTNLGYVQAVNRTNGRTDWIYVFPTMQQIVSYSYYGMPPMMATQAATYKRENQKQLQDLTLMLQKTPSPPKIVSDPERRTPYSTLPGYLAVAWASVAIPLLLMGLMIADPCKERPSHVMVAGAALVLAIVTMGGFFFFGRVSIASSLVLRAGIAILLLFATIYALRSFGQKHWLLGSVILGLTIGLGKCITPELIHF